MSPKRLIAQQDTLELKSSRATRLYKLKIRAREIRRLHTSGKLTAEQAAKQLRDLHSTRADRSPAQPLTKIHA